MERGRLGAENLHSAQLDHSTKRKFRRNWTTPSCKSHVYRQTI